MRLLPSDIYELFVGKAVLLLSILLSSLTNFSQNQARNWFFGNSAGLSFSSSSPAFLSGGAITTSLGCSSISTASGNLLFYTDGVTVFNQTHSVMANGTGLHGIDAFQPALILKQPANPNIYYIFTVGGWNTSNGLKYSIVDMSLAAGMGSVTAKNIVVDNDCRDKLTAGRHCNGTDIWVVSTRAVISTFVSYLLTSTGVNTYSTAIGISNFSPMGMGQLKLSPNGRKLAISTYTRFSVSLINSVNALLNFDNSTGSVDFASQNVITQTNNGWLASPRTFNCEFSSNSEQLYFCWGSANYGSWIYRYSLCGLSPSISPVYLPESNNQDTISKKTMQLAENGNIYLALNGKTMCGAINNANSPISTYNPIGASLGTFTCQWGLPNYPGYYFEQKPNPSFSYTVSTSNCLSANFAIPSICAASGYTFSAYQWNFGDPGSGINNISGLSAPTHTFPAAGNYTVSLIRYFLCTGSDTISQIVSVTQPSLTITNSPSVCLVTTASVSIIGGNGPYSYLWSAGSQTNATATFTNTGNYSVTVSDLGAGSCIRTASTSIAVISLTSSVNTNSVLCFGQSTGSASVTILGGSGNYQYSWSVGPSSIAVANSLAAGVYSVSVYDSIYKCAISNSFTLTQAPNFTCSIASTNYTPCVNQSIIVVANASGGTPTYSYNWNTGAGTSFFTTTHSLAGTYVYSFTVVDSNSCATSNSVSISFIAYPQLTTSGTNVCKGDSLTVQANGANTYTWQPSGNNNSYLELLPNSSTTYTLYGGNNSCISSTIVYVIVNPLPIINLSANSPLCVGQTLSLTCNSFSIYYWQGPLSYSSPTQNPQLSNIQMNQAGFYTLSVNDINNCSATKTVQVQVNSLPTLTVSSNSPLCEGQNLIFNSTPNAVNSWQGPASYTSNASNPILYVIGLNQAGIYNITVSNSNGCSVTQSLNVVINPLPLMTISGNQTICAGENTKLVVTGASTYTWNSINSSSSTVLVSPSTSKTYKVWGSNNTTGCLNSATISITVSECIGLRENILDSEVKIYPNPNWGEFTIVVPNKTRVVLTNVLGQMILERELNQGENRIELDYFSSGIYFLVLDYDQRGTSHKLIMNRK